MSVARRTLRRLQDPFGFANALAGLSLQPADLPTLTRDRRLDGDGR